MSGFEFNNSRRRNLERAWNARRITAVLVALLACAALTGAAGAQTGPENSMLVSWTAPGDDGDVGQAFRYDLRYRTSSPADTQNVDSGWWNLATQATGLPAPRPAGSTDSIRVTGLTPDTPYYFVLRVADDAFNWSGYSNVASGRTAPCTAPSAAPQQFAASEASGDVQLSWSAGSDPATTAIHVYRGVGAGALTLLATLAPSATGHLDTSVSPGTTYRYRAAFAAACDGPSSPTVSITLAGAPPPPAPSTLEARVHAYPNPSSGPVQLVVDIPGASSLPVRIRLYDLSGHSIADLIDGTYTPGQHTISWPRVSREGRRVAPGYYEAIGTIGAVKVRERLLLLP